jgi:hypothetical protein
MTRDTAPMQANVEPRRLFVRSCLLIAGSAGGMLAFVCVAILLGYFLPWTGYLLGPAVPFLVFAAPFGLVPLHLRWQPEGLQSATLALVSGLLAWGLGLLLIATAGFQLYLQLGGSI